MNITLSSDEYPTLLTMLAIAQRVLFEHSTEIEPEKKHFIDLYRKLLVSGGSEPDPTDEGGESTTDLPAGPDQIEHTAQELFEAFEDEAFFRNLTDALTIRDLIKREGEDALRSLSLDDRIKKYKAIYETYADEFEHHGIDRLFLTK